MNTVTKKPSKAKTATAKKDDFINQAGSNLAEGEVKKAKPKKAQIPVTIPPLLLEEMDKYIESTMTGLSRSSWICQAIKEKLDKDKA